MAIVTGNNSSETLNGTADDDVIDAKGGNDTVNGLAGNDTIIGGSGNDSLNGNEGDDVFQVTGTGHGYDTFNGGAGLDRVEATAAGTRIGVNGYNNGVEEIHGIAGDNTVIKDTNSSHVLDFTTTALFDIGEIDAGGGNDIVNGSDGNDDRIRGGSGNDTMNGGGGDDDFLVDGTGDGYDTFIGGAGFDQVLAESAGTRIGVNGYDNGVDEFMGDVSGDTIIKDTSSSHTLNFSNTILTDIDEINANGGNDTVTASDLSAGNYRGGSGNDTLNAGEQTATWLYTGTGNGYDKFTNGTGYSVALAEAAGTRIGVNGYDNGVDEFMGDVSGDTIIKDTSSSHTLNFSNTILTDIDEINANGGNDTVTASDLSAGNYRGGSGNDTLNAGEQTATWLYTGTGNGYDKFTNGTGYSVALAEAAGTRIGVNGYDNGVDEFMGDVSGDTIIKDTSSSHTLNFSNTILTDIDEINANGGNDTVTASDLSAGNYRGGSGNDTLNAGEQTATWLYTGTGNGYDKFTNGTGYSVALAEAAGTRIGVNGYDNGVDEFMGDVSGNTIIKDTSSSHTLDFSQTTLTDIAEVNANGGNDTVTTATGHNILTTYKGGSGTDTVNIALSEAQAQDAAVLAEIAGYAGGDNTFTTLNLRIEGFENVNFGLGGSFHPFDSVFVDTNNNHLTMSFDAQNNLVFGGNFNDTLDGLGGNDVLVGESGNDTLRGGDDDDVFLVGNGDGVDRFEGGDGTDKVLATEDNTAIGLADNYGTGDFSVEEISANGHNDVTIGAANNSHDNWDFSGTTLTGITRIDGGNFNDTIDGSTDDDVIVGNTGNDDLRGGWGNDTFEVGLNHGVDKFDGGGDTDTVVATADNVAIGLADNYGTAFSVEEISANGHNNVTIGAANNSHDNWDFSGTTLTGITRIDGGNFNDTIDGSTDDDVIVGNTGNDDLRGGWGNDTFEVGLNHGVDKFDGGGDTDTVVATADNVAIGLADNYGTAFSVEEISANGHNNVTIGAANNSHDNWDFSGTTLTGITRIDGGNFNDTIDGSTDDDVIVGNTGNDDLRGGWGNDTFEVGLNHGVDKFDGGGDTDTVVATADNVAIGLADNYGTAFSVEEISANGHNNVTIGAANNSHDNWDFSGTTLTGITRIDGGNFNDTIDGSTDDDVIVGNTGNDDLRGGWGNDTFEVGLNHGVDKFDGGGDTDTVVATADNVAIGLADNYGTAFSVEEISANGHNNVTIGAANNSHDNWDFANTTLTDIHEVNAGNFNDTVTTATDFTSPMTYDGGSGTDHINVALSTTQAANAAIITELGTFVAGGPNVYGNLGITVDNFETMTFGLGGSFFPFDDVITGSGGNNLLNGDASRNLILGLNNQDTLNGGDNNDILVGGQGNDTLNGDDGDDVMAYEGTNNGFDVVNGGDGMDMIAAIADNTTIGLLSGYANGVEKISGDGHTGVKVISSGGNDTLDFSNTMIEDIDEIDGGNNHDTITTSNVSAGRYRGNDGNDTFNLGTADAGDATLLYTGTNNDFDSFSGNVIGDDAAHTILAEADNTVIGLNSGFNNGVDVIDDGGKTGVKVLGTGGNDTLNFSGVQFNSTFEIDGGNNHDTITTSTVSAGRYRGNDGNDTFNLGTADAGDATLLYTGTNNDFDSFSGNVIGDDAVHTILAEADNTVIGLNSGFNNGVDVIDDGGKTGVKVLGTGGNDTLNFSGVQFNSTFEIDGGNNHDTITTSNVSAGRYRGNDGNDTFNLGLAGAMLLYTGTNNDFDSFSGNVIGDDAVHTILAEADNTVIGLNSGFNNGVDVIDDGGKTGVKVLGTGGNDTLNFSGVQFNSTFEIDGGNNHDTITTSTVSAGRYRGNDGNDTFNLGTADAGDATLLYTGTNNDFDSFSGNVIGDDAVHTILAEADNTAIGLNSGFNSGVDVIDIGGNIGVKVLGTGGNDTLNFSGVEVINDPGDFVIDGGNNHDTITASDVSFLRIMGSDGNDALNAGMADVDFLYAGTNNDFDSFSNGAGLSRAVATADGTVIGLAGGYASGVDVITGNGFASVTVVGTGGNDLLDFTDTAIIGIESVSGGNNHDTITASDLTFLQMDGGHGNDTFIFNKSSAGGTILDLRNGSDDIDVSDFGITFATLDTDLSGTLDDGEGGGVVTVSDGGDTTLALDDGSGGTVEITVIGVDDLAASDFVF